MFTGARKAKELQISIQLFNEYDQLSQQGQAFY
jgi:hypothetical protein